VQSSDFVALLARQHRRHVVVCFARTLCVTGAAAFAVAAVLLAVDPTRTWIWGAGAALAAAGSAAVTLLRGPRQIDTASAIDARMRLEDRVVAALPLRASDEPVARLIVEGATTALAAINPRTAFPLNLGPRGALVAMAVSAFLVVGFAQRFAGEDTSPQGDGLAADNGLSNDALGADGGDAGARQAGTDPGRSRPQTAGGTPDTPRAGGKALGPIDRKDTQEVEGSGSPVDSSTKPGDRPPSGGNPGSSTRSEPANAEATARRSELGAAPAAGPTGSNSGSASSDRSSHGTGRADSAGGAGAPDTSDRTRAGGIGRGTVQAADPSRDAGTRSTAITRAVVRHRLTADQGEAAMTREDIPLSLRAYVRAYFQAVQRQDPE
jgi:hypothetical protein